MDAASRILLVEDDPILRLGAAAVLADAGYEVLEAANADEAIAVLERETGIRLMISDIQMPGSLDGLKLAHAVRRRWPPVAVLLTSGRRTPEPEELPERVHYLPKPFAAPELLAEVGQLAAAR
ncbi:MAG TPA: response regulator [Dongiaceae bacterium]|jgi:CheY-like chemotaxis protein|nr:response regulator [Dongiaceae bacterium]